VGEENKSGSSWLSLELEIASIGAVLLALFTLTKAYAAAKFSLTTASALLTTAPFNVLLGSLTAYSYSVFPLLSLLTLSWAIWLFRRDGWTIRFVAVATLAVLAFLLSPASSFLPPMLILAAVVGLHSFARWAKKQDKVAGRLHARGVVSRISKIDLTLAVAAAFIIICAFGFGASVTNMWLPAEVVTFEDGNARSAIVGHVLSVEGEWTTVVRATDRGLTRIPSQQVKTRELCHLSGAQPAGQRPILYAIQWKPYTSPNTDCINALNCVAEKVPNIELIPGSLPDWQGLPCQPKPPAKRAPGAAEIVVICLVALLSALGIRKVWRRHRKRGSSSPTVGKSA
jgi:hypothetical protein